MTDELSRPLHRQALRGSPTVSGEAWELFHDRILASLRPNFKVLDDAAISTAVTDVILDYAKRPQQYDPERLSLRGYLRMAVQGDLLNLLEKQTRERNHLKIIALDDVADEPEARNIWQEAEDREARLAVYLPTDTSVEAFMRKLPEIIPDAREREVIVLMAEGERDSACFAVVLGCEQLDVAAQRKLVKQVKDRIRLRLKRYWQRPHE